MPKDDKKTENKPILTSRLPLIEAEALFFRIGLGHPIDTMGARFKVNQFPICNFKQAKEVAFQDAAFHGIYPKISSVYRGLFPAIFNRGAQMISMETQSYVETNLKKVIGNDSTSSHIFSSMVLGFTQAVVVSIPNQWKVQGQLNSSTWVSPMHTIPPTALRNCTWFLTKSNITPPIKNFLVKQNIFGSANQTEANEKQQNFAEFAGASLGSLISIPFDVIKTRIQAGQYPRSTLGMFKSITKKEGVMALGRGTPFEMGLQVLGFGIYFATKTLLSTQPRDEDEQERKPARSLSA